MLTLMRSQLRTLTIEKVKSSLLLPYIIRNTWMMVASIQYVLRLKRKIKNDTKEPETLLPPSIERRGEKNKKNIYYGILLFATAHYTSCYIERRYATVLCCLLLFPFFVRWGL